MTKTILTVFFQRHGVVVSEHCTQCYFASVVHLSFVQQYFT